MKILYCADLHSRVTRPAFRVDPDFLQTILAKVDEVVELAEGVDLLLFGGDLFHSFKPDYRLVNEIMSRLQRVKCEVICVVGNHDLEGGNFEALNGTALGTLLQAGVVSILTRTSRSNVELKVIHYRTKPQLDDYTVDWSEGTYRIICSHDMITPSKDLPFECVSVDEVAESCNAHLVLCSHYHVPFRLRCRAIKFVNPGSLTRLSLTPGDVSRIPQVALITVDEPRARSEVELIPLKCARPGIGVFDIKAKEAQKLREASIESFLEKLRTLQGSVSDDYFENRLRKMGKELNIEKSIVEEAVRRLSLSEKGLK